MATTFWSLSVTNTAFSPAPMHFLAHAACSALAPLAPHLESLTQPLQLMSFATASTVMLHRYSPITNNTFFFMVESPFLNCRKAASSFYEVGNRRVIPGRCRVVLIDSNPRPAPTGTLTLTEERVR